MCMRMCNRPRGNSSASWRHSTLRNKERKRETMLKKASPIVMSFVRSHQTNIAGDSTQADNDQVTRRSNFTMAAADGILAH